LRELVVLLTLKQHFSYIMAVWFIGWWKQSTFHKSLKLYRKLLFEYAMPWMGISKTFKVI